MKHKIGHLITFTREYNNSLILGEMHGVFVITKFFGLDNSMDLGVAGWDYTYNSNHWQNHGKPYPYELLTDIFCES